jgi:alpha-tubulin suppressor-like RCC1 family protein
VRNAGEIYYWGDPEGDSDSDVPTQPSMGEAGDWSNFEMYKSSDWAYDSGALYFLANGEIRYGGKTSTGLTGDGILFNYADFVDKLIGWRIPLLGTQVVDAAITVGSVAVIGEDGRLWTWGNNGYGQFANGTTADVICTNQSSYPGNSIQSMNQLKGRPKAFLFLRLVHSGF